MKVYIVGRSKSYASWISEEFKLVQDIKEADLAIFTGGEDVSPELYGDTNVSSYDSPSRDLREVREYLSMPKKLLKVGICRGAQFLTACNGGKLIQDVNLHAGRPHELLFNDGSVRIITSLHHQMMYPYNLPDDEYELIAWSKERLSNKYVTGGAFDITNTADFKEPEIVYYPKTNSFCIQGHPEMMPKDSPINTYINNFVKNHINNYE